jgi:hypothetical protein
LLILLQFHPRTIASDIVDTLWRCGTILSVEIISNQRLTSGVKSYYSNLKHAMNLLVGIIFLAGTVANAQIPIATYPQQTSDFNEIIARTKTSPVDDSILVEAPDELGLIFPKDVHLVKLILRDESHEWVDFNFRYSPRKGDDFNWPLPGLGTSDYYTAEWAILEPNDRLIRGSFSFSFGEGAERPSLIRELEEMTLRTRNGEDENTRFVTPPRTKIIIDREPPVIDPPFTIRLNVDNPD